MADQHATSVQSCAPIKWIKSASAAIYITYFMSSWGDRMWQFAVGLYLVIFDEGILRLAAIFGFTKGICILFLGGPLGHWVDVNPRLKVVRVSLVIQNTCVALSAVGISFMLHYHEHFYQTPANAAWRHVMEALVILLAILAALSSVAYNVSIEKDWIVVVSAGDKAHLASLNATTRAIDLVCNALAPLLVAQIMTFGSRLMGAVFIAVWNVVSVGVEYSLLMRVYKLVPRLEYKESHDPAQVQKSGKQNGISKTEEESSDELERVKREGEETEELNLVQQTPNKNTPLTDESESKPGESIDDELTSEQRRAVMETDALSPSTEESPSPPGAAKKRNHCVELILGPFIRLIDGWSLYVHHKVCFAGVALGCLYMTVLGFDSITVGYIYSQGISESILGVCTALAAVTGIIGTFIYTKFRKWIGLNKTGIFGFMFEVCCLTLAVASIWAPGSPFGVEKQQDVNCSTLGSALNSSNISSPINISDVGGRLKRSVGDALFIHPNSILSVPLYTDVISASRINGRDLLSRPRRAAQNINMNTSDTFIPYRVVGEVADNGEVLKEPCNRPNVPNISVILFLVGIVVSRIGLWIADLTVTQTFQENVDERERGTLGGVQNSVNRLLDTIKFILVIVLPNIHTFGILIILSFCFIVVANCFFFSYVARYHGGFAKLFSSKSNQNPEVNIIYRPKDPYQTASKV